MGSDIEPVNQSTPSDDQSINHVPGFAGTDGFLPTHIPLLDDDPEEWDSLLSTTDVLPATSPLTPLSTPTPAFPCLDGVRYSGCIGAACPLELCWNGAPTVGYRARSHRPRTSSTAYLGEALCHRCVHVTKTVSHLSVLHGRPRPASSVPAVSPAASAVPDDQSRWSDVRTVICGQDQWRYAITMQSFLTLRVPIRDEVDPAECPSFEDVGELRPEVAAYRESRRQTMRNYRDRMRLERVRSDDTLSSS